MEDQNLIKAKMGLKKGVETKNCLILVSQTRASRLEEKREKKRGRRGRRRRRRTKVCFFFFFFVWNQVSFGCLGFLV